jgi:group I intron endonuclease
MYRIICAGNGRFYIGSSCCFGPRKSTHLYQLRKGNHHSVQLQRAFKKHGESSLIFEVLEAGIPVSDLLERETSYIARLKPHFNGSLVSATRRGSKQSDACKAKVSAANLGRKASDRERALKILVLVGNRRSANKQNRRKVTPEIRADIDRLAAGGMGSYRIAKSVGLSKKTIINVRHRRHNYG